MSPVAASEGEMVAPPTPPPACNQGQEQQQQVLQSFQSGATEKEEEEALRELSNALHAMEALRAEIDNLLNDAGPRRGDATDDRVRHFLDFLKEELCATMASLRMKQQDEEANIIDEHTAWWLQDLKQEAKGVMEFLGLCKCEQEEAELRRHSLVRKSASFLVGPPKPRLSRYYNGIIQRAQRFIHVADDPLRYKHLLLSPSPPSTSHGDDSNDDGPGTGRHQTSQRVGMVKTQGLALGDESVRRAAKKLLRWLTSADKRLRVMSIVGPAGVGKTTLAVAVYGLLERQSSQGGGHFQCSAMAEWSRNPDDVEKIHRHVLIQITSMVKPIACLVPEILRHKRYFILLDDICATSDWLKVIKNWFPSNNCGSRILITTRTASVAARFCWLDYGGLVHEMQPLNESDSQDLLRTKAFGSKDDRSRGNKNVVDEILIRCGGIPLFIIGMADWLKQNEGRESLEEVPELVLDQFEKTLSPTYEELPYMSRLLSLYMSMFPMGYVFEKHHLLTKWSIEWPRQGTIWDDGLRGAEQHFHDLADRNIITRIPKDRSQNLKETEEACLWQLNYFVLRFLASKSREEGFVFTSSTSTSTTAAAEGETQQTATRRLALHYHTNPPVLLQNMDLSKTRSLAISGAADEIPFDKLTYLVALDLEGWEKLNDEQPLQICNCSMFTLTYLSIRNTRVSKIPQQIYKMYSLKILDISHTKISELPSEVCELENLKKLDARSTQISKLPEEICMLTNLQDLLVGGNGMVNTYEAAIKIPVGIKSMHKLQTLAIVDISASSEGSIVDSLGYLNSMRVLAITWSFHQCTDAAKRSALQSSIGKLKNLQSLCIHCGLGCPMEFLGDLTDPPKNLGIFKVTTGMFDSVPRWIQRLNHLVFLQITVCKHEKMPDNLNILKDLPKLDCLVLGLEFTPTEKIAIGSDGFSELRKFSVDCPVPWLTFRNGGMPKLTCLELNVSSVPAGQQRVPSGTINLQGLMEVLLYHTNGREDSPNVKMVVDAVEKEVAKHHNPINLFINGVIREVERDDDLFRRAVNYLEKRRTLLQPLLILICCCWLHMPVSYVG